MTAVSRPQNGPGGIPVALVVPEETVAPEGYDPAMMQYESKDDAGHKFWTARHGRYAVRIDANKPGLYRWMITLDGPAVRKGAAPNRDEAAAAVQAALEELPQ